MDSSLLAKQIETYSNAIVAFTVIQGLAYLYYFGTSPFVNCIIKASDYLAEGLVLVFSLVMILSVIAIRFLGRTLENISSEFSGIVHKIYLAKSVVVLIFGLLQISITILYGVLPDPGSITCRAELGR
jgi:hypothetical protein